MRNDLPKAITAEDVIRRFDLSSLVKDRKEIKSNKQGLDKSQNILYNFIDGILKGLNNTENQVDGKISTWFFTGIPTISNTPASEWTTDEDKNNHIGDLYYDKANGNTYQFIYANETYEWQQVLDNDINEAMALANSNPDTEDGRRNIFVVEPIPPYEVGDIWIKSNGDVYRCNVARESGIFNPAEWIISSEYTNDNYVNDARAIIDSFNEFITANYVCKVLVKTTNNSIELSVSSATTKITNDYTAAISQSEGRAEIREGQVLLQANRYTSGEISRVEGEIGDIADITQTQESEYAKVHFTNVPLSEPINITIHPIINNISLLYPFTTLYPSNTLYPKIRTLRFTNLKEYELTTDTKYQDYKNYYTLTGTEEYTLLVKGTDYQVGDTISGTIYENTYQDYELPDDLLYYDSTHYDILEMDYTNQICKVTKKCKYNSDGSVSLLDEEKETEYPYPQIELTLGDYDIELITYSSGYLFARVMSNNVYVNQFVTKTKLDASINVLPHTISLQTAELVSGTQCGITIKLRDANGNELDSKEANITLSGKVAFDDLSTSGRTIINGGNITTGTIDASVVNVTNINATNIKTGTLKSSNYVANTSGMAINLSNGSINSKNFKLDSSGNASLTGYVKATSGEIGGCTISNGLLQIAAARITSGTIDSARIPNLSANKITTGTLNGTNVNITNLNASNITGGTINGSSVNVTNINASNITTGTISTARLNTDVITTSNFSAQTISANQIRGGTLSGNLIRGGTMIGTVLKVGSRESTLDSAGNLSVYPDAGGVFRLASGGVRLNAKYGVAISSNGGTGIYATDNNIDIKACSRANVYIGCMSNSSGSSEVNGIMVHNGGIYMSRQPSYGSDKRLKKNIKKIKDINWIDELKVREYEYKTTPGQKNIGLIAQDYEGKDYAKYFLKQDNKGYYSIEYGNITNALIQYCQKLNQKIKKLEKRNNNG